MEERIEKECPFCGEKILIHAKKCRFCGEIVDPVLRELEQIKKENSHKRNIKVVFGDDDSPVPATKSPSNGQPRKNRLTYILLGIFLGGFGVHNFYAGYVGRAVAQLLITLLLFWLIFPLLAVSIWVIIEVCTVKKDAEGIAFVN